VEQGEEARQEEPQENLAQPGTLYVCPRIVRFADSEGPPKLRSSIADDEGLLLSGSGRALSIDRDGLGKLQDQDTLPGKKAGGEG